MLLAELSHRAGALDLELELGVERGRRLALLGPSGAGKTTVLRCIAGLARGTQGRVVCDERVWLDSASGIDLAPEQRRCGMLFQDYALFGHLDARANVAYGLRGADRAKRADGWLERLGVAEAARRRPRELSGGERQRVALARALAPDPDVLLLDEPLSALDPATRAGAAGVLREALDATGVPAVIVTHDFLEAAVLADEIVVVEAGRVVQRGGAADLAARPATAAVASLSGAVVLTGTARAHSGGLTAIDLDGGGEALSAHALRGPVALTLFPWEIALEAPGPGRGDSARNRLAATVTSLTVLSNRVRVGLDVGQPLVAEVTVQAARELELEPGRAVVAVFKATATRLVAR